jgi:hypothetical protein
MTLANRENKSEEYFHVLYNLSVINFVFEICKPLFLLNEQKYVHYFFINGCLDQNLLLDPLGLIADLSSKDVSIE